MAKLTADSWHVEQLSQLLHERGAKHLRARKHGSLLIIESGPENDPWHHARLRRDTVHLWSLDMPGCGGRWERTPFRGQMVELVDLLFEQFSWVLANFDEAR